ncbi:MAG: NTPase [Candidatus Omnitrophica bacterium]|nr:NTPase [Candidatus Omnitrophota bacterium]HOX54035.1 NTPase [Candidatus Omnitrophota bacterium]
MNILITGKPGAGKTTLVKKISQELKEIAGGFYTEEIRRNGKRVGFKISALDGTTGLLAHIEKKSEYRFSKYAVLKEGFERVALPALKKAMKESKVILVDEIGPMELFSETFKNLVLEIFEGPRVVIATIKHKGSPFIESLKKREDVKLFNLTKENFDKILREILQLFNIK